jgi:long-chain acyl-CoA synthetase
MDFREISPQIVVYPSRVWETLVQTVERNMKGGNRLKKAMYDRSLRVGRARADLRDGGSKTGPLRWFMSRLADFLVLRPLRDKHGLNRARVAYAAGGVLSDETSRFFQALDVDITQVFGSVRDGIVVEPVPEDLSIEQ